MVRLDNPVDNHNGKGPAANQEDDLNYLHDFPDPELIFTNPEKFVNDSFNKQGFAFSFTKLIEGLKEESFLCFNRIRIMTDLEIDDRITLLKELSLWLNSLNTATLIGNRYKFSYELQNQKGKKNEDRNDNESVEPQP